MEEDPLLAEENEESIHQNEGSGLFELITEALSSRKAETPNYDATSVLTKEAGTIDGASPQLTMGRLRRDTSCVVGYAMTPTSPKLVYVICADDCYASQAFMVGGIAYATECKRNKTT